MGFLDKLKITKLVATADKAIKKQEFEKAIECYTEALALKWLDDADKGSLAIFHTTRAIIFYRDLKDYDNALTDLDNAIELNPQDDNIWTQRGIVLGICGQDDEAYENLQEALRLNPRNTTAKQYLQALEQ